MTGEGPTKSLLPGSRLNYLLNDGPRKFFRTVLPAQVRSPHAAFARDRLESGKDALARRALSQMFHHHRPGPNGGYGIGDAAAFDVGSASVHRLKHGRAELFC